MCCVQALTILYSIPTPKGLFCSMNFHSWNNEIRWENFMFAFRPYALIVVELSNQKLSVFYVFYKLYAKHYYAMKQSILFALTLAKAFEANFNNTDTHSVIL